MSICLIRVDRNSSERYPVKTGGGRERDTIVEASEASHGTGTSLHREQESDWGREMLSGLVFLYGSCNKIFSTSWDKVF